MKAKFAVFVFFCLFFFAMDARKLNPICLGCLFCQGKNFLASKASLAALALPRMPQIWPRTFCKGAMLCRVYLPQYLSAYLRGVI